jgi:LPS-assembly protein
MPADPPIAQATSKPALTDTPAAQSKPGAGADAGPARAVTQAPEPSSSAKAAPAASAVSEQTVARLYENLSWDYCGPSKGRRALSRPAAAAPLPPAPTEEQPIDLTADTASYDQSKELVTLTGNVRAERGSEEIIADQMTYNRRTADAIAEGNAYLAHPGIRAVGTRALVNLDTDQGTLSNAHYRVWGSTNAHGTADQADFLSRTLSRYNNVTYTTCAPGNDAWWLQANKLNLDQAEGVGVARDATLRVLGMPVLYTPYLSFPISDRRKSGFLVPSVGSSNSGGFELITPYYWNIAPNMDATFSPIYMAKRGLMLGTELRYLAPVQRIDFYGEGIAEDNAYADNSPRGAFHLQQTGHYGPHWSSAVNFNYVSDDQYLQDFGNRLEVTSARNIERRGDLVYSGAGWTLLSRLQDFQTVDPTIPAASRPYARLPQLLLTVTPYGSSSGVEAGINGEYDYFYQPNTVYGQRLALQPYLAWTLRRPYGYLVPRVNLYQTGYLLENKSPGMPDSPGHVIPSLSVDSGLIFERNIDWFGKGALQTLEPRLYYLLTPYVDQSDTPVFDSSNLTFSFASLFWPNRFSGRDRVGDANQLTLGLTTRTLDNATGTELFSASVGQIYYFRDREVQIAGPPQTSSTSSIAGELTARVMPHWSGRVSLQWNPDTSGEQWERRAVEVRYETPENRLVNLAYRFDQGTSTDTAYNDTDISFHWPVNPQLGLVGRWFYSFLYHETVEAFAGLEYGRCCWRVRMLARRIKTSATSNASTSIMFQVELAGLGAFGDRIETYLERGIYGYQP